MFKAFEEKCTKCHHEFRWHMDDGVCNKVLDKHSKCKCNMFKRVELPIDA